MSSQLKDKKDRLPVHRKSTCHLPRSVTPNSLRHMDPAYRPTPAAAVSIATFVLYF